MCTPLLKILWIALFYRLFWRRVDIFIMLHISVWEHGVPIIYLIVHLCSSMPFKVLITSILHIFNVSKYFNFTVTIILLYLPANFYFYLYKNYLVWCHNSILSYLYPFLNLYYLLLSFLMLGDDTIISSHMVMSFHTSSFFHIIIYACVSRTMVNKIGYNTYTYLFLTCLCGVMWIHANIT